MRIAENPDAKQPGSSHTPAEHRRQEPPGALRHAPGARVPPEPLACRRCGALTIPKVSPGTGPHALKANCPDCGGFLKWLSKLTPEEQAQRREVARLKVMAQAPPTIPQLAYLKALGDTQPTPANRAEAFKRIDDPKRQKGVA